MHDLSSAVGSSQYPSTNSLMAPSCILPVMDSDHQGRTPDGTAACACVEFDQEKQAGTAAAAENIADRPSRSEITELLRRTVWGVDTMASCHLSGNRSLFSELQSCEPITIHVANGCQVTATQRGTIHLQTWAADRSRILDLGIREVYYHPEFSANLLSWGMLRVEGWEL
jgi:hypothetical protein